MRLLALTGFAFLGLAAPASATPSIDPLKPCYASDGDAQDQRETVHVHATGFTPAAHLVVKIDGAVVAEPQADVNGATVGTVPAPFQGRGERPFTLTIEEQENTFNVASATALVTNLSVTLRPKRTNPSHKVRFSGRGFTMEAPIYGHYLFGGKVRKTVRFARRPESACGVFHAKRRQIPARRPATGDWILQVDQQHSYSPHPASNVQPVIIRVRETFTEP